MQSRFLPEEGVDPVYALGFSLLAAFCVDLIFLSQVAFVLKTLEQEAVSVCFGFFFFKIRMEMFNYRLH